MSLILTPSSGFHILVRPEIGHFVTSKSSVTSGSDRLPSSSAAISPNNSSEERSEDLSQQLNSSVNMLICKLHRRLDECVKLHRRLVTNYIDCVKLHRLCQISPDACRITSTSYIVIVKLQRHLIRDKTSVFEEK